MHLEHHELQVGRTQDLSMSVVQFFFRSTWVWNLVLGLVGDENNMRNVFLNGYNDNSRHSEGKQIYVRLEIVGEKMKVLPGIAK